MGVTRARRRIRERIQRVSEKARRRSDRQTRRRERNRQLHRAMNIDYENLERDIGDGTLRLHLEEELTVGFRQIQQTGERLPVPSHYAAQIAEIINRNATLSSTMQFELYQEV